MFFFDKEGLIHICFYHNNRADETAHHFLIECQAHEHAQHGLRMILGQKSMSIKHLLGKSDMMKMLLDYVAATGRLKTIFGDVSSPPLLD